MNLLANRLRICLSIYTVYIFISSIFFNPLVAQQLAFPGAEGFGKFTTGGRGGRVIEVTNLNDDGPGSLRDALKQTGARTIVFRVGGTIVCNSPLVISDGDVTIAGQTAPGGGIAIRGAELRIVASNVIVRYIRVRPGDSTDGITNEDGIRVISFSGKRTQNVIIDHCSVTWGKDEMMEIGGIGPGSNVRNVTVQNSIIGENINTHYGLLLWNDAKNISVIKNLFVHNSERNIRSSTCTSTFEMVNNLVYGYKAGTIPTYENHFDIIGNVYKTNPNVNTVGRTISISASLNNCPDSNIGLTRAYIKNNLQDGQEASVSAELNPYLKNSNVVTSGVVPMPANQVEQFVLANVGANLPKRDAVDIRLVNDVKNRTGGFKSSTSSAGGYPNIEAGTAYKDTDKDGMSDVWESANGLNPNDASDRNGDKNGNGYTNLEDFLNSLTGNTTTEEEPANLPPTIKIDSPNHQSTFPKGSSLTIKTTANDEDGTIRKVEFFVNNQKVGEDVTLPFQLTRTFNETGTFTLTAKATDNNGATKTSAGVTITIENEENQLPTVILTSPGHESTIDLGTSVLVRADAQDPDGTVSKVEFYANNVKIGENTQAPYQVYFVVEEPGNVDFKAVVTDNKGATATSEINTVTVKETENQAPSVTLINPADNATYFAEEEFTLIAEASDADGSIAKVVFYIGGSKYAELTKAPYEIKNFDFNNPGTYRISVTAFDDKGAATSSETHTVTAVLPENTLPTVKITAPADKANFDQGATITLKADASDTDGTITKVEFFLFDEKLGEKNSAPYELEGLLLETEGSYEFTAVATDNRGGKTTSSIVSITVSEPVSNQLPSVSITSPEVNSIFTVGDKITISANASDKDGSVAKVEFFITGKKVGEDTTAPYQVSNVELNTSGRFFITAVATDNLGAKRSTAGHGITVEDIKNQLPTVEVTSPAVNSTFQIGNAITIEANASDSDGTIAKVEFFVAGRKVGEDSTAPYQVSNITLTSEGRVFINARAIDNLGGVKQSSGVGINVVPSNVAPEVRVLSPASGAVYFAGDVIAIDAEASDSDGLVTKVEFFVNGSKIGEDTTAPYQFAGYQLSSEGTYSLSAVATDNEGATANSGVVEVVVGEKPNAVPVANIISPNSGEKFKAGDIITIKAEARVEDGTIVKVEFFVNDTKIGESTEAPYQLNHVIQQEGTYLVSVRATDNKGEYNYSSSEEIIIGNSLDELNVTVYPNPFVNELNIQAPFNGSYTYQLANASGQTLKYEGFEGNSKKINISGLPKGIYFLIVSDYTNTVTKTVIKK